MTLWAVLLWTLCTEAPGGIIWFNSSSNRITYASGGTDYLQGNRTDFTIGCFVQLINAGQDGLISIASIYGDGITGDDAVIATAWIGMNVFGADVNGWINNSGAASALTTNLYYVRAWDAPASDYSSGLVPSFSGVQYGNSDLWTYPGDGSPPGDTAFNFGGAYGFATTLTPVPEPTVLTLGLAGLVAMMARRRRA